MIKYFDTMISGIETAIRTNPEGAGPRKKFALEILRLGKRLYTKGNDTAWCGIAVPFDILNAMDITSCFVEFVGATLASNGVVGPFLEAGEQAGYGTDGCSYHRSVMGAAARGLVPEPRFFIGTTTPCTGGIAVLENLSRIFKREMFVLQVPMDASGSNVKFLASRIRDMVGFIENKTGKKLDPGRLREAVTYSNEASALMAQVYELAKKVPSPAGGRDLGNFGIIMPLFSGTKTGVEIAKNFKDDFQKRIDLGESGVAGEKIRLLWIQNRIQFKNPLVKMLEEEYHASVVIDEFNNITWEPIDVNNPFESMAARSISIPFNGPVENRISHLKRLCREYRVDGAINPSNWGCRQGSGARGLIEESLKDIGVPVINLEVDCVDTRSFAEGQIRTRLEAFLEMIGSRPSPWK